VTRILRKVPMTYPTSTRSLNTQNTAWLQNTHKWKVLRLENFHKRCTVLTKRGWSAGRSPS